MEDEMRAQVSFEFDDRKKLNVRVDTERLTLQSVTAEDAETYYRNLWSDPSVVRFYATGKPKSSEYVRERIDTWVDRYKKNDVFSALAVRKNDDDSFVGHVVAGHGDEVGQSELAYLFTKRNNGTGYAREAVGAVVGEWVDRVIERGYKVNKGPDNPEGETFTSIFATAHTDNASSIKILEEVCKMDNFCTKEKFGHLRHHYKKDVTPSR